MPPGAPAYLLRSARRMQLAFSSNAYTQFPIEEAAARIAAAGYTGLELLADVPHAWPVGLLPERRQAIRDCLAANNLTVSNVNGFMMNAVADPRQPYWHPRGSNPIRIIAPFAASIRSGPWCWPRKWVRRIFRPSRAGRFPWPILARSGRHLLRRADALRRSCRAAGGRPADRTGTRI